MKRPKRRTRSAQIKELAKIERRKQYGAVLHNSPLHSKAFGFMMAMHNAIRLVEDAAKLPAKDKKWVKFHWRNAIEQFRQIFHKAWKEKDGNFFHALGDVIEREKQDHLWTPRQRFIAAQCSFAENQNVPLPTAGQLLRGWKLYNGLVPMPADDLKTVWNIFFEGIPIPSTRIEIEKRLRPVLGKLTPAAQAIQHTQISEIQRDAKELGFVLLKQKERGLPAGIQECPTDLLPYLH